jgi:hypothetical protein
MFLSPFHEPILSVDTQRGPWIAFVMELSMADDPVDCDLEAERAYWETRLATLEMLLCDLLIKNERLRQERLMFTSTQSGQEPL